MEVWKPKTFGELMNHIEKNSKESRSDSDSYSVNREQPCKLHVAFLIDSLHGGGAELSVLTAIESLLQRNYTIDLVLLEFHGRRLSLIPNGVNLFVLDQHIQLAQQIEECSIPIDDINWMRCPTGFTKTLKIYFNCFQLTKIERLPPRRRYFPYIHSMSEYLQSRKPELIVANLYKSYYISILGRKFSSAKIPVIWSIRNDDLYLLTGKHRVYFNQLIREVNRIHTVSRGLADSVTKYLDSCKLLTKHQDITTIYNGFNTDRISALAARPVDHDWFACDESQLLNDDFKTILAVGRLHEQKNFELLINAFSLTLQHIDARLIILGEGERRNELENLVEKLKIAHSVSMPGWVDNPYSFMAKSDVFVSSSNFEGFPRALTEAMICGCPVVSTDCPSGPREILENGRWGHITPVDDLDSLATAILESLSKDVDRVALQARGKIFGIDTIIEEHEKLFRQVVSDFNSNLHN